MSLKIKILPNEKYGRFTVIKELEPIKYKRYVLCKCICGEESILRSDYLKSDRVGRVCRCSNKYLNKKFSKLTILKIYFYKNNKYALCKCDCGKKKDIRLYSIINKYTKSCGCLSRKYLFSYTNTKNFSTHILYNTYSGLINRCYNSNNPRYNDYGGRGIYVCRRWRKDVRNFIKDMGDKPSKEYSIDRIDNNQGYIPFNCKWSTPIEQTNNMRNNKSLLYKGELKTIKEWSKKLKISYTCLQARLSRGWSIKETLNNKLFERRKNANM